MKESTVNPSPLFDPNSEEEYLDPTDDVEMNNESDTSHAGDITPVPQFLPNLLPSEHREILPLPRHASNIQAHRTNMGMVSNDTLSIMPVPQPNTAAHGTVVLFRRNPDSPLFKVGDKRPTQEEDEEHRKQKDERRKNQMHVNVRVIQLYDNFVC